MLKFFQGDTEKNTDAGLTLSTLAILFLFLFSVILTLSPAVRYRSWSMDYLWSHWVGFLIWLAGFIWFIVKFQQGLSQPDHLLVPIIGLLSGWGVLSIWRLNAIFGIRQAVWFFVCALLSGFIIKKPFIIDDAKKYKYLILIFGLLLAALTFIFGTYPGGDGPRLWLGFRGIYFQPSELLKLLLIIYLSAYFSETNIQHLNFINSILPALILFFSALILLLAQRDLGTSLIFIVTFIFILFVKTGKRRVLLGGFLFLFITTIIGYLTIDLVRIRFQSWILPWIDPREGSYQIIQSIIAIAAGGISGSGIGLGSPRIIPIAHSDFIFSAMVEETGLFGAIGIIILYALLFSRGIRIAITSKNQYYQYLSAGIVINLTSQAILIMGGNIRLLPITGVTLPFLSYGGSSLLISFMSGCILLIISSDKSAHIPKHIFKPKISKILYASFFSGLFLIALVTGWWSFIRSQDLQFRTDNPRQFIAARFVQRGTIFDINGQPLAQSTGSIGNFKREYLYPPLSNTLGYSNSSYGNTGLESQLDDYLSGERGYPSFDLWFNHLLYDQPLPGRNIRLSLDLGIQKYIDKMLGNHIGSGVVINAATGEILAIASHPFFDANEIEVNWDQWRSDKSSPMLNRATQSAYPMGTLITPFLLSKINHTIQDMDNEYLKTRDLFQIDHCAIEAITPGNPGAAVINGCDSALIKAAKSLPDGDIQEIIRLFALDGSQDIGLPINPLSDEKKDVQWFEMVFGSELLRANPLQIATAASALSAKGVIPTAKMVAGIDVANEGWVVLPIEQEQKTISEEKAASLNDFLISTSISGWEVTAAPKDQTGAYSWYVAGTPTNWPAAPIVVVLVIENDNPEFTRLIGRLIYQRVTE